MKTIKLLIFALAILMIPCSLLAQDSTVTTVTSTETMGTVSAVNPDTIVVKTETSTTPTSYSYTKSTTYVDDMGNPVSMETVESGSPVTVYYTQDGDEMVATKVVVRKTTTTNDAPSSTMEMKRTTTTTETTK